MYMLGYEITFGHMEALQLIGSMKYQEKAIGYLALGLLINEKHEISTLLIQSLQNDLASRNEYGQSLALALIANIGGAEAATGKDNRPSDLGLTRRNGRCCVQAAEL